MERLSSLIGCNHTRSDQQRRHYSLVRWSLSERVCDVNVRLLALTARCVMSGIICEYAAREYVTSLVSCDHTVRECVTSLVSCDHMVRERVTSFDSCDHVWWPEMEDMGLSFQIIAYAELTSQTGNLFCQAYHKVILTASNLVYFVIIEDRTSHQRLSDYWWALIMHPTV